MNWHRAGWKAAGLSMALLSALHSAILYAVEAPLSVNDYGGAGLWQTPTARFSGDGDFAYGVSNGSPYTHLFATLVPLPGVEATLRYSDISNRLYSPIASFSGDQSYKHRGVDLRFRLWQEGRYLPEFAAGFRDIAGTQLFAGQFLVASRRYYDFDFSLGLGWGRMGAGGGISNPFEGLTGKADVGQGGKLAFNGLYGGPKIGVFGGVNWKTPIPRLDAVVEYDGNNFQSEPLSNNLVVHFPLNFGLKYRFMSGVQAGLAYQRGDTLSLQLALLTNFSRSTGFPKVLDTRPPLSRAQMVAKAAANPVALPAAAPDVAVQSALQAQNLGMSGFSLSEDGGTADIHIGSGPYRDTRKTLGRAARAAAAVLPDSVTELRITGENNGMSLYQAQINRSALDSAVAGRMTREEFDHYLKIGSPEAASSAGDSRRDDGLPSFSWGLNPALRSSIGGPDGFYFGQLLLKLGADTDLTRNLSVSGQLGFNIYNNFNQIKLQSDSQLPHVRSDIVHYLQDGQQSLIRLESNYIRQLAAHWYGRLSAGIFEEMYGGVAGELLYRPADPRWALGLNLNRVRQRDFDQRFSFRDYQVTTGNLTAYLQLPRPSILLKLSAGRYLAGDYGATVDISRQFQNGIRVGVFATKTDVPAVQFGEGSFDKGFYIVVPFDLFLPISNRSTGAFLFRPLTRDGGQMVRDGRSLYSVTEDAVRIRMPERSTDFFE